jgi:sortase family protein
VLARADPPPIPVSRVFDHGESGVSTRRVGRSDTAAVVPAARACGDAVPVARLLRGAARIGLAIAVVAALLGSAVVAVRTPLPVSAAALPRAPVPFDPVPPGARPAAAVATATTLDVPRLRIRRSSLVELGVDAAGVLVPPASTAVAGWYTGSAVPGRVGPTVVAGHVDSSAGPGIFYRLDTLRPGDLVSVGRSDGVTVRYRVTEVLTVPKDAFPTDRVYGPTPDAELRLITCGGEFDHNARRYLRNVVVSAVYADAS